jgi:uncharacterized protein YdgA (DUF945 family)
LVGNPNFAAGYTIRQRIKNSLQHTQFGSECEFAAANTTSAANRNFAAGQYNFGSESPLRWDTQFGSELQICCRQYNFGSESQIRWRTHNAAANVNSLQSTQFQQRITNWL